MILALILVAGAVVFFTLFEQAGSSLNLFADRNTQLPERILPPPKPSPSTPVSFCCFAPLFAILWTWLARNNREPDPIVKFGLGLFQVGSGFSGPGLGCRLRRWRLPPAADIPGACLSAAHHRRACASSPVGLSEITKLSVPALVSTMMAVWFLSSELGAIYRCVRRGTGRYRNAWRQSRRSARRAGDIAERIQHDRLDRRMVAACFFFVLSAFLAAVDRAT